MTEADCDTLSEIAPTVASPAEFPDYGTPWRETTRICGEALGVPARAESLIADLDERFAEVREAHPELDGAEGLVACYSGGELGAYVSADLRSWRCSARCRSAARAARSSPTS